MFRATFTSGDLTINFRADGEKSDYGVPGSPVWWDVDPDSIVIDSIEILGHSVPLKSFPPELQKDLYECHSEAEFTRCGM